MFGIMKAIAWMIETPIKILIAIIIGVAKVIAFLLLIFVITRKRNKK